MFSIVQNMHKASLYPCLFRKTKWQMRHEEIAVMQSLASKDCILKRLCCLQSHRSDCMRRLHVKVIIISEKLSLSSELRASVNESRRKLLAVMVNVDCTFSLFTCFCVLLLKNEVVTTFPIIPWGRIQKYTDSSNYIPNALSLLLVLLDRIRTVYQLGVLQLLCLNPSHLQLHLIITSLADSCI